MKPKQCRAKIIANENINNGFYNLVIQCPYIAENCTPGQFAMLDIGKNHVPYIRRPLAIAAIEREDGTVRFIYKLVGNGTHSLSEMERGSEFTIIGPLGNGYTVPPKDSRVLLVAGGIGITSIMCILQLLRELDCKTYLAMGSRDKNGLLCMEEVQNMCTELCVSTEDGTVGYHGMITPVVEELISKHKFDIAYMCGPESMMKFVSPVIFNAGIHCEVSMERRMGCGIGVCVGCSCKLNDPQKGLIQKRVCKEGPVFNAQEVVWNG